MDASLQYLMRVVNSEIHHAQKISDFLKEKESALIAGDAEAFRLCTLQEQSLFVKARKLEDSRLSVVEVIARKHGYPEKAITLGWLAEQVESPLADDLKKMRQRLKDLYCHIQAQSRKCEVLLKKSIEMVHFSLNLLIGKNLDPSKTVYDRNLKSRPDMRPLLDRKG